jgi:23S rRNA pseudouridine955/2504/2580 synthase
MAVERSVQHVTVDVDAGQRIDNFLLRELAGVPRSRVYRMVRKGEVRVNGRRVGPFYKLRTGDVVRVPPWHGAPEAQAAHVPTRQLEQLAAAVLFENDALMVVNKPAGLAVHGGSGIQLGLIEMLRQSRPELDRLTLVHRLDRDTSGCLLLAKTRPALLALHRAFRQGQMRKTYELLVHGAWPRRTRTVSFRLTRYVTASGERRVRVDASGKPSRTDFELERRSERVSWLRAHPQTGRTHQIRVHAQATGHPLVGDQKYATEAQLRQAQAAGLSRLYLHASVLTLPEAAGGHRFEVPVPDDFDEAWNRLAGTAG